jgi:predicted helicase
MTAISAQFRWASDRIGDAGIMAFVSGSAWIERSFADGMRKCLVEEYSDLYVFHLRGDIRKNMLSKGAAKEGQNIFGSGSMTGISIALLVKNPQGSEHGRIHFHDIGPDLATGEKLGIIRDFRSIEGITRAKGWQRITPDAKNDWLDQVDPSFDEFPAIGAKRGDDEGLFDNFSQGVLSSRDAWAYNASRQKVADKVSLMIEFYNAEVDRFEAEGRPKDVGGFVDNDTQKISWSRGLKASLSRGYRAKFSETAIQPSLYRPFTPQWQYFDRRLNEIVYQMPRIFPNGEAKNLVIAMANTGARSGFGCLMANRTVDFQLPR